MHPDVVHALSRVIDPELRLPITELGMVGAADLVGTEASATIKLTVAGCPAAQRIEADCEAALRSVSGVESVSLTMSVMTPDERTALKEKLRGGRGPKVNPFTAESFTRVFLIGSGKGGVGKSTLTANLAASLAARGLRVGLIDADIFGFSIPEQLGLKLGSPEATPTRIDEMILPPVAHGVKVMSIGMFLQQNQPVAWRGPMLHRAIEQFVTDVFWGELDFLLVDLPPGTGDVAISVGQLLQTAKTIVVTTPQAAAAQVAERSGAVGLQTGQPIFGVIENLSWLEQNGSKLELFGSGGGDQVAARLSELSGTSVPVLGQIPISVPLREGSDQGEPVVLSHPTDPATLAIAKITERIAADQIGLAGKRLKLNP